MSCDGCDTAQQGRYIRQKAGEERHAKTRSSQFGVAKLLWGDSDVIGREAGKEILVRELHVMEASKRVSALEPQLSASGARYRGLGAIK